MTNSPASRKPLREWMLRLVLVLVSVIVTLLIAEAASRVVHPISDGRDNVTMDGQPIKEWFEPSSVYRQVSNEYDAVTTITDKGHRVPGTDGNPEVIFLGDSFTYGYGLSDDQTFPSIYCERMGLACANLGMPSSGTLRQVERPEEFLDRYGWHPREVRLFFFGMSSAFSAGNDFVDNYHRERASQTAGVKPAGATAADQKGLAERIIGLQSTLLYHSHLLRLAKYYWGPMLKSMLIADPGERMTEAVAATEKALARLDDLSRRAGFEYRIYLIVPAPDIIRRTDGETLAALNGVSPKPVTPTADLFRDAPQSFYYAFDGHLNPEGSRRIAEFLVSLDTAPPATN